MIVLDELFTNVVEHGHTSAATSVEIALTLAGEELTIEFSDEGPPFDPLVAAAPDLDQRLADRPIGGLGIHILRSLADRALYRREGGRNHLILARSIPAPDTPERA